MMIIVTTGSSYLDIDSYAGCVAYAELLRALGKDAQAVSTAPFNESITSECRAWPVQFESVYSGNNKEDEFVIIDTSEPHFFDHFVNHDRIIEIIDHHPGHIDEWKERLGDKATIEIIGAACTLVYEKWRDAGKLDDMSESSARLLAAGILDNTLYYKAGVSTDRDRQAYDDLAQRGNLSNNWPAKYFADCQSAIESILETAIKNDAKRLHYPQLPGAMGQLVVWDARRFAETRLGEIRSVMSNFGDDWLMNLVSISEGKSYFVAGNPGVEAKIAPLIKTAFKDGLATADRLWLRKELLQAANI
jgi:inorganic pyrophosphatase